jgi:4-nitrophenyl phosphatase
MLRALILDMDGVLWRGDQPIGDLPAIFNEIKRRGLLVTMATNNATLSVEQYLEKLSRFGVVVEKEQIVNSAGAVAYYLSSRFPQGGAVYIIGEAGLRQAIQEHGFTVQNEPAGDGAEPPLAVVVGLDRNLTYEKLMRAALLIRAGAPFIATNPDRTLPMPQGLIPGAGSIVAAVQAATDQEPVMIGKPKPVMYQVALERMGVRPEETLVVGDRLETDIAGAQELGCRTALVLSGVSTLTQAKSWSPSPEFITADLADLIRKLA